MEDPAGQLRDVEEQATTEGALSAPTKWETDPRKMYCIFYTFILAAGTTAASVTWLITTSVVNG